MIQITIWIIYEGGSANKIKKSKCRNNQNKINKSDKIKNPVDKIEGSTIKSIAKKHNKIYNNIGYEKDKIVKKLQNRLKKHI